MNLTEAAALLRSSTTEWRAFVDAHPDWDTDLAQHISNKKLSLVPAFHNWTKMGDCLASPWLRSLIPSAGMDDVAVEWRPLFCIFGHIRRLQLKSLLADPHNSTNVLLKTNELTTRAGWHLGSEYVGQSLFVGFTLAKNDIYQVHSLSKPGIPIFGVGGTVIGDEQATAQLLARYMRVFAETMHEFKPTSWSKHHLGWEQQHHVADECIPAITAHLWYPHGLTTGQKLAMALMWSQQSGTYSTVEMDTAMDPDRTERWQRWAVQAQLYLQLTDNLNVPQGAALAKTLEGCVLLKDKPDSRVGLPNLDIA